MSDPRASASPMRSCLRHAAFSHPAAGKKACSKIGLHSAWCFSLRQPLRCKTNLVAQPTRESDKLKQKVPHAASRLALAEKTNSLLYLPNILGSQNIAAHPELQHINIRSFFVLQEFLFLTDKLCRFQA
jgi:hypothetical protein